MCIVAPNVKKKIEWIALVGFITDKHYGDKEQEFGGNHQITSQTQIFQ